MRALMFFAGGALCGLAVGAAVVLLTTPKSGGDRRDEAKQRLDTAMTGARAAADAKQKALEAELAKMTTPVPA